jgi:hypothetical protein
MVAAAVAVDAVVAAAVAAALVVAPVGARGDPGGIQGMEPEGIQG